MSEEIKHEIENYLHECERANVQLQATYRIEGVTFARFTCLNDKARRNESGIVHIFRDGTFQVFIELK